MNVFDKKIKESIENHEFDYNPQAWDQLSARLDQVMPVQKNAKPWKSILGGSAILATALFTYYTFTSSDNSPVQLINTASVTTEESTIDPENSPATKVESPKVELQDIPEIKQPASPSKMVVTDNHKSNTVATASSNPVEIVNITKSTEPPLVALRPLNENNSSNNSKFTPLALKSNYCEKETIILNNDNSFALVLEQKNKNSITIQPHSKYSLSDVEAGEYQLRKSIDKTVLQQFSVNVNTTSGSLEIKEDYHYVQGVPYITLGVNSATEVQNWSVNGVTMDKNERSFIPFNKGEYQISFQLNPNQGCPTTLSKNIQVQETYNLIAPNAFNTNSINAVNRTFIPYALTQRETAFEMIIIEPTSGRVIFRTNSIDGWNGIDQGTGELVAAGKAYVWKVTLGQALKGERKEYSGIVTRVE